MLARKYGTEMSAGPSTAVHRRNVLAIGALGDLSKKTGPAFKKLYNEGLLRRVVHAEKRPPEGMEVFEYYVGINGDNELPLTELAKLGLCDEPLLVYVAGPSWLHGHYAMQALRLPGDILVAVEKPFGMDIENTRRLVNGGHVNLVPIEHVFFKKNLLDLIDEPRNGNQDRLVGFELDHLETNAVGNRDWPGAIYDLAWHLFSIMLILCKRWGLGHGIVIEEASVGTYLKGLACTAARIKGWVVGDKTLPFTMRVAKGVEKELKKLVLRYDGPPHKVPRSLGESGWRAHWRVLQRLVTQERPDLLMDTNDAMKVVEACWDSCTLARWEQLYTFGSMPEFLKGGEVSAHN
jgi:hypothetical protein